MSSAYDKGSATPLRSSALKPCLNNENISKLSPLTPNPTFSEYEEESTDDDNDLGITEKLERRRHKMVRAIQKPMSSPIRSKESPKYQSRALGEKYTLRARNYIPFHQKQRNERRDQRALELRGGNDEMEKFLLLREKKQMLKMLEIQANELHGYESEIELDADTDPQEEYEAYMRELEHEIEEMERLEDEELDELFGELKL